MGVRLEHEFDSIAGTTYTLQIIDTQYTDPVQEFTCTGEGPQVKTGTFDVKGDFQRICTSRLSFTMYLENTYHNEFYRAMVASPEGRFFAVLKTTGRIIFQGTILPDVSEIELSHYPTFSVTAVDGLEQLKSVTYTEPNERLSPYTFVEHLTQILQHVPYIKKIKTDTDPVLSVNMVWTEERIPDPGFDNRTLEFMRMKHFFYKEKEGELTYYSCYDVLMQILVGLGARIYYNNNSFILDQIGARIDDSSTNFALYQKDGTFIGSSVADAEFYNLNTNDNIHVAAFPRLSWMPAIRQVALYQRGDYLENLMHGITIDEDNPGPVELRRLTGNDVGKQLVLSIRLTVWKHEDPLLPNPPPYYAVFKLTLQVQNERLKADPTIFSFSREEAIPENRTWTTGTSADDGIIVVVPVFQTSHPNGTKENIYTVSAIVDIPAPDIMTFNCDLVQTYENDWEGIPAFIPNLHWRCDKSRIMVVETLADANNDEKDERKLTLVNDEDNSIDIELQSDWGDFMNPAEVDEDYDSVVYHYIDDLKSRINMRLEVWDGTDWVYSYKWTDPDNPTKVATIQEIMLREYLAMRAISRQLLNLTMYCTDYPYFIHKIQHENESYVPLSWEFLPSYDEVKGVYFETNKVAYGTDPLDETVQLIGIDTNIPPGLTGEGGAETNLQSSGDYYREPYYKKWIDFTGSQIDLSDWERIPASHFQYKYDSLAANISLYVGGVRYKLLYPTDAWRQNSYMWDFIEKKIILWRNLENVDVEFYSSNRFKLNDYSTS